MSLIDCCEQIGAELHNTIQGKSAYSSYLETRKKVKEIEAAIYFPFINKEYVNYHFFAPQYAVDILKANIKNDKLGTICERLLSYKEIHDYAKDMAVIGGFIDKIINMIWQCIVPYSLPKQITPTPNLIRLVQDLSVECQRLNLMQKIIRANAVDPKFQEVLHLLEEERKKRQSVVFSKADRDIAKTFIERGYLKESIELIYTFSSVLAIIKMAIYEAFHSNILTLNLDKDVDKDRRINTKGGSVLRLTLSAERKINGLGEKWILRLVDAKGKKEYGHIYKKVTRIEKGSCSVTVHAVLFNFL